MDGQRPHPIYHFDDFVLDTGAATLLRGDQAVPIEPQSLALLRYLVENRHRVVPRAELVAAIWQRPAVTDWAVDAAVRAVRRTLGDASRPRRYLQTVHGHGFRFVADLTMRPARMGAPILLLRPFTVLGPDPAADTYLAAGLAEDLIADLRPMRPLSVLSRNASLALSAPDAPLEGAGVTHVLDGALRRQGARLRLTLTLSARGHDVPQWGGRFDAGQDELFELTDRITPQLVAALLPDPPPLAARTLRVGGAAYDCYLHGRFAYHRYTPGDFAAERLRTLAPKYSRASAARMFPYPDPGQAQSLRRTLAGAGVPASVPA